MAVSYKCVHCDVQFEVEDGVRARCPQCMRRNGLELAAAAATPSAGRRRRLFAIGAVALLVTIGGGYFFYQRSFAVNVDDAPPPTALSQRTLDKYLAHHNVEAGQYARFLSPVSSARIGDKPVVGVDAVVAAIREAFGKRQRRQGPHEALNRPVKTAEQTAALLADGDQPLYPLELAALTVAVLREQHVNAALMEVWLFEGERSPPDPNGLLSYFIVVVDPEGTSPRYVDPYGGRSLQAQPPGARVLNDIQAIGYAIGTDALRVLVYEADMAKALVQMHRALELAPRAPSLRLIHGRVLLENGGVEGAFKEVEAALQIRGTASQLVAMAEMHLAQAAFLYATGDPSAAENEVAYAGRRLQRAQEQAPDLARIYIAQGAMQLVLDDAQAAKLALDKAEGLGGDRSDLALARAQYDLHQGQRAEAVAEVHNAVQASPDRWQLHLQAAQIYATAGEIASMQREVQLLLSMVPGAQRQAWEQRIAASFGPVALEEPLDDEGLGDEPTSGVPAPNFDLGGDTLQLGGRGDGDQEYKLRSPGEGLRLDLD